MADCAFWYFSNFVQLTYQPFTTQPQRVLRHHHEGSTYQFMASVSSIAII